MSEKKDIKDLKEVVIFGFRTFKFGKDLFNGGHFQIAALGGVIQLYPAAVAAFDNIGDAIPQAEDIDAEEMAELAATVISEGALNEHAADIVAKSLKVAASTYELIKAIKA